MYYPYLKALHIVGVLSWFAGLIYIGRLFIYLTENAERPEPARTIVREQLQLMAKRLWFGITWPAGIWTSVFGFSMVHMWIHERWMQVKLVFVFGFIAYHLVSHWLYREIAADRYPWTSRQLRIWNEVLTLLMVGIVFLVVLKSALSFVYGAVGLVVFGAVLMAGISIYKRVREG
ncbi:MAG: CopD family protein [Myxococcales bacterium]|nr:CopD family protein [Myxococcales bacterium]MCB9671092.1 CopD family protein [Alphaproteobacteria bacterium]MCB9692348.1 CopD family protein [Alphaproteobacteria bacterium]